MQLVTKNTIIVSLDKEQKNKNYRRQIKMDINKSTSNLLVVQDCREN